MSWSWRSIFSRIKSTLRFKTGLGSARRANTFLYTCIIDDLLNIPKCGLLELNCLADTPNSKDMMWPNERESNNYE